MTYLKRPITQFSVQWPKKSTWYEQFLDDNKKTFYQEFCRKKFQVHSVFDIFCRDTNLQPPRVRLRTLT